MLNSRIEENHPSWKGDKATDHAKYTRILRARQRASTGVSDYTRKLEVLVPQAQVILTNKKFTKAAYLAKKMEVSPHLAGRILAVMPEWTKYTNRGSRNTWIKGTM